MFNSSVKQQGESVETLGVEEDEEEEQNLLRGSTEDLRLGPLKKAELSLL